MGEYVVAIDVETLETSIPVQLGHVPLDRFRVAEGVVIRPARELRFNDHKRVILKKKARAFWEATNQGGTLYREACTSADVPVSGVEGAIEAARHLLTENRLRAVISKDPGLLKEGQAHKLAGLFAKDALEDLEKQHGEELHALGKDMAAVRKAVQLITRAFVMKHAVAIREDV